MKYRPIQIGSVVLPEFAQFQGDIQVAPQDVELAFTNGSFAFETKSKVNSRACSVICSYFDAYNKDSTELKSLRSLYFNKLQSLNRTKTTLYLVCSDNLIYKLKVVVGAGQFNGEEYDNGFDFIVPLKGYDPFLEECTDKMYFAPLNELLPDFKYPKYDKSISYNYGSPKITLLDGKKVEVPLIEFDAPNIWNPIDQYISKQVWATDTATATISGTGTTSFDTSDFVTAASSLVLNTSNTSKTNTATLSSAKNISLHLDTTILTKLDVLEFKLKVSVLNNLDTLDLYLQTDNSNYIKTNLIERISYLDDGIWSTVRLYLHEFTEVGIFNYNSVASIKIDHKNTGAACTIKINDLRIVKVFGLGMSPVTSAGTDIDNPSQNTRIEGWFCFKDNANTRQIALENNLIQTTKRLLLIKENGYAEGDTPLTMVEKGVFNTEAQTNQINIAYNSDQVVSAYFLNFNIKL